MFCLIDNVSCQYWLIKKKWTRNLFYLSVVYFIDMNKQFDRRLCCGDYEACLVFHVNRINIVKFDMNGLKQIVCLLGGGESAAIRNDRAWSKADKQLVHQPKKTALETIWRHAICHYGWCKWQCHRWRTYVVYFCIRWFCYFYLVLEWCVHTLYFSTNDFLNLHLYAAK